MFNSKFIFLFIFLNLLIITNAQAMYVDSEEYIFDSSVRYNPGTFECGIKGDMLYTLPQHQPPHLENQSAIRYISKASTIGETVLMRVTPGKDGRKRVPNPKETHSAYVRLKITYNKHAIGYGSGTMVGRHHILTCGHNIYDWANGLKWPKKIEVQPALNDIEAPFGSINVIKAFTFKEWVQDQNSAFDMGILVLESSIGLRTGWEGMLSTSDGDLMRRQVDITGYPGDLSEDCSRLYTMEHRLKTVETDELSYEIDTYSGQSGSPISTISAKGRYIIGVHTRGIGEKMDANSGVRITQNKFSILTQWIRDTYVIDSSPQPTLSLIPPHYPISYAKIPSSLSLFTVPSSSNSRYSITPAKHAGLSSSPIFNREDQAIPPLLLPPYSFTASSASSNSSRVINKKESISEDNTRKKRERASSSSEVRASTSTKKEDKLGFRAKRVGYKGKNYEDDYQTVRMMIKKIGENESKAAIAEALEVSVSVVCRFMDETQKTTSPTLLSAVNKSIKNKRNNFSKMVEKAYKVVISKKHKNVNSNNAKKQRNN
jgi:V8-like Glu-specific endopeptidase